MTFENPLPEENINVSPRNHLIDFFVLVAGTIALILIITLIIGLFAGFLAKRIPFEYEQSLSAPFENIQKVEKTEKYLYLENLVNKLAKCSDLPEEMQVKFHYSSDSVVNAFATLGGNIIVFQGMIDEVENENQLAMIIAHEIAHIKYRHPIQSLGRGVIVSISFSLFFGSSVSNPLQQAGLLTLLKFGRSMETQADTAGLQALQKCYGHVNGASQVFENFEKMQQKQHLTELPFLATHPLNSTRIENIKKLSTENNWQNDGKIVKFPELIKVQ